MIDGKIDEIWNEVPRLVTSREVAEHNSLPAGAKPATADVKCLWDDGHLYCLAVVKDPRVSTEADEAWQKDSVEFFVDGNMARATSYDDDDAQYRTDADGEVTVGSNNDAKNYESKVTKTDDGYIVESRIKVATEVGKYLGFDVQINNNTGNGTRDSTAKWNDSTNESFQDLSRIGAIQLIEGK